jgi:hypothetical protein
MIFWRQIVIFHTKYRKLFSRLPPLGAIFLSAPPLTWNPGSAPEIIWYFNRIDAVDRPTVVYACTLCDPSNQKKIKSIEQVQKRTARFVHNNYRHRTPGCVIKMVNSLKWENLEDRRKSARLCTLFKFYYELIDIARQQYLMPKTKSRIRGKNASTKCYMYVVVCMVS